MSADNSSKRYHICNGVLTLKFGLYGADIIQGKLDQRNSQLEVDVTIGRDIQAEDIGKISATLQEWCNSCETVLNCIETQIDRANSQKGVILRHKEKVDAEVCIVTYKLGVSQV